MGIGRCDACGGQIVERRDGWVHADQQAAARSSVGPHEPLKIDPATTDYLRNVLGGGGR